MPAQTSTSTSKENAYSDQIEHVTVWSDLAQLTGIFGQVSSQSLNCLDTVAIISHETGICHM